MLQGHLRGLELPLLEQGRSHAKLGQRSHVALGKFGQHFFEQHHGRIVFLLDPGNVAQFIKRPIPKHALGKLSLQLVQFDNRRVQLGVVLERRTQNVQQLVDPLPLGGGGHGSPECRNRLGRPLGHLVAPSQQQSRLGFQFGIGQTGNRAGQVSNRRVKFFRTVQAKANPHRRRRHVLVLGILTQQPAKQGLGLGPVGFFTQQVRLSAHVKHFGPQLVLGPFRISQELRDRQQRLGRLVDLQVGQCRHVQRAGCQLVLSVLSGEFQESGSGSSPFLGLGIQCFTPEIHQLWQPWVLGKCRDRLVVHDHRISRFLQFHQGASQPRRRLSRLDRFRLRHHGGQGLLGLGVVGDSKPTLSGRQQRLGGVGTLGESLGQRLEHRRRFGQLLLLAHRVSLLQQREIGLGEILHCSRPRKQRLRLGKFLLAKQAQAQPQADLGRLGSFPMSLEETLVGHHRGRVCLQPFLGSPQSVEDVRFKLRRRLQCQCLVVYNHRCRELLGREQALGLVVQSRQCKSTLGIARGDPTVFDGSCFEVRGLP